MIRIESASDGTLRLDQLPELDERTLLILQARNVNTGAFDKFEVICELANSKNAWIHVDGAFGLWVQTSQSYEIKYTFYVLEFLLFKVYKLYFGFYFDVLSLLFFIYAPVCVYMFIFFITPE